MDRKKSPSSRAVWPLKVLRRYMHPMKNGFGLHHPVALILLKALSAFQIVVILALT